jgi:hypothetical protein
VLQKGHDKPAAKVDVTYTWKVAVDGGGQTGEPTFTLKQDGDKAKIVYSGTIERTPPGDGQGRRPRGDVDRQAGCVQEGARGRGPEVSRRSGGCVTAPEARLRPGVGRAEKAPPA